MRSDNSHKMLYLKNFKHETRSHSHSIWSRSSRERSFEIFHSVRLQQILAICKRVKIFKIGNTRLSIRKTLSLLNSCGRFARGFQKQYNRLQLFLNTKDTICDKCQQDIEGYVCSILHFFCINIHLKKKSGNMEEERRDWGGGRNVAVRPFIPLNTTFLKEKPKTINK